jgi:hypothetical protein
MENITIIQDEQKDGTIVEHIVIAHADGSFTSMLKSTYDEQQTQAEHFTPIVIDEAETI